MGNAGIPGGTCCSGGSVVPRRWCARRTIVITTGTSSGTRRAESGRVGSRCHLRIAARSRTVRTEYLDFAGLPSDRPYGCRWFQVLPVGLAADTSAGPCLTSGRHCTVFTPDQEQGLPMSERHRQTLERGPPRQLRSAPELRVCGSGRATSGPLDPSWPNRQGGALLMRRVPVRVRARERTGRVG